MKAILTIVFIWLAGSSTSLFHSIILAQNLPGAGHPASARESPSIFTPSATGKTARFPLG
jgi:hypothetical protein